MPPILTASPVSNAETERRAQEIIYAFYQYWFSGTARTLGQDSVTFPSLPTMINNQPSNHYLFNQQQSTPPAKGPEIHTILTDLRPMQQGNSAVTKLVRSNAILTIYVRVRNPSDGMQSADFECRFWADAIKRIFDNGTQPIAQLGIHHAAVRRGPVPIPTGGMQTRMVVVTAKLQYETGY